MDDFRWQDEPELMARLSAAQNAKVHWGTDLLTIVAMFKTREQLLQHVLHHEKMAYGR